jgi:hypothetical protein
MSETNLNVSNAQDCSLDEQLQMVRKADLTSLTGQTLAPWGPAFRDQNPFRNSPFNNVFNNAFPNVFKNKA